MRMNEGDWLLAENGSKRFAVPGNSLCEMVSGADLISLPFSGEFISGVILHGGRAVPVFRDEASGFGMPSGDLMILDREGDLLALPVKRIAGFCRSAFPGEKEVVSDGMFRGTVGDCDGTAAALDVPLLYKKAGFI
ncbi:MAG TPA: hypothetical protein PK747_01540 [Acidobacteriota bacterium]|nr:hypothetical protein [Acidobacteriota bacterium]HNT17093.1 hypothetical protein [Acidobacteriota bacterium]HPA26105.1 hypothetical protein [Acidobacteriota bacterium]HQO19262.1 hypothetical protein [Acidobacteriota bacterium]HQQ46074.1 hypothetical protein [Acidobacteriota bacterium]